ncbi:hypothetical protein [Microtetraspora niveoalba]|uniref:hypothetical protein n=1 Tax=Microtetraspora niveoalba TaxID=46175 RepID=UPI00082EB7A3|nr:hypothetical protein [Microtetraspora niveoalba]
MDSARGEREPGTPPRPLVALAAAALVAGTGYAMWLLPARAIPDAPDPAPSTPAGAAQGGATGLGPVAASAAATAPAPAVTAGSAVAWRSSDQVAPIPVGARDGGPSGYVVFVDAVRDPGFDLAGAARSTGAGWYTLGHLAAGPDGCTPRWGGVVEQGGNPAANGLGPLRALGGDAGIAFGGPSGRELAQTCRDPGLLLAAYRRVIGAFDPAVIDFEVRDSADEAATARRAAAVGQLQREAAAAGRPLAVTFTLPASESGLSTADAAMLRSARAAGVEILAVNLLVPFRPGGSGDLHRLAVAARAARAQFAYALGVTGREAWRRMGLAPVLTSPRDLGGGRARRLADFRARNGLAWVSIRGARPDDDVVRVLGAAGS